MELEEPLRLPYFRDPSELPAPLPTLAEIHAATDGGSAWKKKACINNQFFVKYGVCTRQTEAENLLFVEKNLKISAPKLYAAWREPDGSLYIIMEYLPGDPLKKLWPDLEEPQKALILWELRQVVNQIRALPGPKVFATVSGGLLTHDLIRTPYVGDPDHNRPFANEREFLMSFINNVKSDAKDNNRHSYIGDFFERELLSEFVKNEDKHIPTFTHADFHQLNILVTEREGQKGYNISLIDWEAAGWYPSYWEYVAAFLTVQWDDNDWGIRLGDAVDSWPSETTMMKMIHQILWF
ncbi:hypothetical protein TWF481_004502 [Arthrobotrys musiformis]|uniref:Aminoglycoside phosphotransferase domain-containing protein n=1 Tax=Arthrobotrys musiformis TaxID=47236 RepID=A0AAV9WJQ1_9PEZI